MAGEIQALYTRYQQKYPHLQKDELVEVMLDDGVINFDTAKKIKSGISLFLISSQAGEMLESSQKVDLTEILGGEFNKTTTPPKTQFNGSIETTYQGSQGDCWLLSDINALSYTEWGRQAIKEAILPDEDGSGGVTIRFKGSPIEQKDYHFTAEQIEEARQSKHYSDGDDDMIALELATNQAFVEIVRQGLGARYADDEKLKNYGLDYRSYITYGMRTQEYNQYPISELLGINGREIGMKDPNIERIKDKILRIMSTHNSDIAAICDFLLKFNCYGDTETKDFLQGNHAYAIKKFEYGKTVTLTNPHYSDYEIKVPWKDFVDLLNNVSISFNNPKIEDLVNNILPQGYNFREYVEELEKSYEEADKQRKFEAEQKRQSEIDAQKTKVIETLNKMQAEGKPYLIADAVNNLHTKFVLDILNVYPDFVDNCLKYDKQNRFISKPNYTCKLVKCLTQKAKEVNVDKTVIDDFNKKCDREFNAIIYINFNTLEKEIKNMVNLINMKNNSL